MAKASIYFDWSGQKAILVEAEDPKGNVAADKVEVLRKLRERIDEAEKALERPEVAMSTAPVARAAQANTGVAPRLQPKPSERKR